MTYPLRLWRDLFSELEWLLRHGIALQSALQLLLKQHRLQRLHLFLYHCLDCVTQGHPLSFAISRSKQSHLFQAFIVCGETSGNLESALSRCVQWLSQTLHFRSQCRSLLFYPSLLFIVLLGGSALLLSVIVPEFYALYNALNAPIPASMQWLWDAHLFLKNWGGWIVCCMISSMVILGLSWRRFEPLLLRIPAVKQLCHAHECAHLGMLLAGGIPIYRAFHVLIAQVRLKTHRTLLSRVLEALTMGQTLAQAYQTVGWHDGYLCDMLRIAEHTGTLDKVYLRLSDYYTHQLDNRLQRFKQEWQPLILLGMGLLVGGWVLLLYYPLIQLGYAVG